MTGAEERRSKPRRRIRQARERTKERKTERRRGEEVGASLHSIVIT